MGIARGPNIVKDNLVFGYDTGYGVADNNTATRFYPGETTENLIYDMGGTVTSAYPEVVYRSTATETNVIDTSAPGGKYSRFTGIDGSSNNQLYSRFSSYSIDVRGDSVNYSVYLKGSGTCHLTIYDNSSGYGISPTITLTSNWVRYNYTRTVNASATSYWVAVRGVLDTTDVYIAGQQAKRGTHATPYVENNRSSTQSLIDLKKTTNIDVSNVSFDSTGQPEFDGTDDDIEIPYTTQLDPTTGITFEAWIYPTDITTTTYQEIYRKENASGRHLFSFQNNGTILSFGTHTTVNGYSELDISITSSDFVNKWNHVVASYNSGNKVIYVNGQSIGSTTSITGTLVQASANHFIGSSAGAGEFFQGSYACFKMYNRGLSADEVEQNFNAYKNRFNI